MGVTAEAEVTRTEIEEQDLFVILASDGIWEFLSSEEAVQLVAKEYFKYFPASQQQKPASTQEANFAFVKESCSVLVRAAIEKWKEAEDVVDDCTCCIIKLN